MRVAGRLLSRKSTETIEIKVGNIMPRARLLLSISFRQLNGPDPGRYCRSCCSPVLTDRSLFRVQKYFLYKFRRCRDVARSVFTSIASDDRL